MTNIDAELHQLLLQDLSMLRRAAAVLSKSYEICRNIGVKKEHSFDELTEFEALSGRFARLVDLLIQKIFRLIDELNLAPQGTVRDSINRAEKNGLIDSAEHLVEMRRLRNQIAHEYVTEKLAFLFERIVVLAPTLLECIERTQKYCEKKWGIISQR
jgi:uncharacterized protein YutE (UPF0331/DUF86 family)